MGDITVVVTDLDGTLWDEAERLHPLTTAAIAEVTRRGLHMLVATGRRVTSTRDPLARLGLAPPAVVLNGALALDLATNDRFHRHTFRATDAVAVLNAFVACGLEPCVYVEHHEVDVFVGSTPSTHPDHLKGLGAHACRGDLDDVVQTLPVLAFGVMGRPADELQQAAARIEGLAEAHLSRAFGFPGAALTVAPPGLSKWAGVISYCDLHALDPATVLAVGDGPNDIELLSQAAVAVVPHNGHRDALALADHVIEPPEQGGWAGILTLL